jgi:hypothetical protein
MGEEDASTVRGFEEVNDVEIAARWVKEGIRSGSVARSATSVTRVNDKR